MTHSRDPEADATVLAFPSARAALERDTETELLMRVRHGGDEAAFRQLFELLAPRINSYLRREGVALADAENALQDVWLVVWRNAAQFNPALASARTWIFTLVRNRVIDLDRSARREARLRAAFAASAEAHMSYEPDFLAQAYGGRAARLLTRLPVEQREIILKCYIEGKSQRDLALEAGVPLGTIKSRVRLAFARLKQLLNGDAC